MHEMICNWFWKSISYQENIHFPLHNYMFVRSGIEFFKNHMKRLLVCCWLWSCSSCDHVALRNLILDARHSRSFDSRCIQKFVEVDCKIRLFICLLGLFCSIGPKIILQTCLVSCMILLWDFRSYFPLLIDEMTISELNWVMPSGFQSLRLFCVFAHMGEESVVLQNRIWRKICVFPVVFRTILAARTFSSSQPAVAHHLQNLFLDQLHQLVHPFVLKLLRSQEHAKLAALDKYTSCRM